MAAADRRTPCEHGRHVTTDTTAVLHTRVVITVVVIIAATAAATAAAAAVVVRRHINVVDKR